MTERDVKLAAHQAAHQEAHQAGNREVDRTKGALARALRRRAAELDAQEGALLAARPQVGAPGRTRRAVRQPNGRNAHQVAFFARRTFQRAATAPPVPVAAGREGNLF